jgi:hypothetical protein
MRSHRILFVLLIFLFTLAFTKSALAQSGTFSSITATSPADPALRVPIFSIARASNVITVSTSDPSNTDNYALQFNRVGASVTVMGVNVDPSFTANGTFTICGPPTPGCVSPTTNTFSYLSAGLDFSASGSKQLGAASTTKVDCPLIPTGYFSFCGDPLPGAGLANPSDKALVEFIGTQDNVGSVLFASSLGDGNTGTTRATGCEQAFIESGNEWLIECFYKRTFSQAIDFDMKNALFVLDVGDGTTGATAGEIAMSGARKIALFGTSSNRVLTVDMGAVPPGNAMPSTGTLRIRNGSTLCWENAAETAPLCQGSNANDKFTFDSGVVTPTYGTASNCNDYLGNCGSAAAGFVSIAPGTTSVTVFTTAVTGTSQIFVQEDSTLASNLGLTCNSNFGRTYQITARGPGAGFIITASAPPLTHAACLSYHILN